jgi:hypothetical protein
MTPSDLIEWAVGLTVALFIFSLTGIPEWILNVVQKRIPRKELEERLKSLERRLDTLEKREAADVPVGPT